MEDKQNLHTHSTFCDGKDTPEEMILAAIEKGFSGIGFSGHSHMPYSPAYKDRADNTSEYKSEINRLKKKYNGIIDVFLGLETDMFYKYYAENTDGFDYLLGAMHYFRFDDGTYVGFDRSAEVVQKVIDEHFGGNGLEFARAYYNGMAHLPEYGNFDIIAHYDLITKNIETVKLFDTESKAYRTYAVECLEALAGKIPFFEVNTGAIARGYRTSPYPSEYLLKEMKRLGFGAVISSDCHNKVHLDCYFEESRELLAACGFDERYILTPSGFKAVAL